MKIHEGKTMTNLLVATVLAAGLLLLPNVAMALAMGCRRRSTTTRRCLATGADQQPRRHGIGVNDHSTIQGQAGEHPPGRSSAAAATSAWWYRFH